VTSNFICPAYVRTPLVERVMLTEPAIKRLIEPEEVAELAAFLCAPQASFINGGSLVMDGGWTAR
jgi:3-hydroxybutyrate dehydrogenase